MSKTRITVLLIFVMAFTSLCGMTSAESGEKRDNDFLMRNGTQAYVDFCTGFYLMLDHRWEDAIVYLKKTLLSSPDAERIHNYLATCYFQLNMKEKAVFHIEKIAQLKPDDFSIHYTLGNIYESEGNEKGAVSEYERANSSAMNGIDNVYVSDMLHRLASLYMNNGKVEKAADVYKRIIDMELTEEPVKIHYQLGQIYIETKKIKEAASEFARAKEYTPHSEPVIFYLALCHEELQDYDKAVAELESFMEYDPESWFMRINLSNIYEKVKKYDKAESEREKAFEILKESVGKGSKNLREYITLSQLFQKKGNGKEAAETLTYAISNVINEDDDALKDVRFMLANLYYEMNDHENVIEELEKTLQIDPDNHQANNFLGYYLIEKGEQLEKALGLIEKALSVEPENGAYLDSLGWAYYKLADEDDGEKIMLALKKLIEASNYVEDPEISSHIGDVYYSLGLWERARNQWENALRLWGESAAEASPHLKHETARELKAMKTVQDKLDKLQHLKMVENSMERLKSGERVASNHIK